MRYLIWQSFRPLVAVLLFCATCLAEEPVDLSIVHRIKAEAFQHSKVMDHLFQITDRHGPRLTASPNYDQAASWAVQQLREYGIESATLKNGALLEGVGLMTAFMSRSWNPSMRH